MGQEHENYSLGLGLREWKENDSCFTDTATCWSLDNAKGLSGKHVQQGACAPNQKQDSYQPCRLLHAPTSTRSLQDPV